METVRQADSSFSELIKEFKDEAKILVKQEVQLAKTEISEKVSHLRQNAVTLAIGGFAAYAGLIVFLGALGMFLAMAWRAMDLSQTLSVAAGLGVIALLVMG